MKKDNVVFLKHILDAINLIEDYLKDKEFQEFRNNHMLQDAVYCNNRCSFTKRKVGGDSQKGGK